jgi:hypothetical protein
MANPHIHFTLGFHIWFGSLDFFCTGVDHDLVRLSPSVPIHYAFLLGLNERVEGLNPIGVEGESTPSSLDTLPNVNSISESIGGLCLHANEAQASGGIRPHGSDHPRLECQLDTILGPRLSQEGLYHLRPIIANALSQALLSPEMSATLA